MTLPTLPAAVNTVTMTRQHVLSWLFNAGIGPDEVELSEYDSVYMEITGRQSSSSSARLRISEFMKQIEKESK